MQEVAGSSPAVSTKRNLKRTVLSANRFRFFLFILILKNPAPKSKNNRHAQIYRRICRVFCSKTTARRNMSSSFIQAHDIVLFNYKLLKNRVVFAIIYLLQ